MGFWKAYSSVRENVLLSVSLVVAADVKSMINLEETELLDEEDIEALLNEAMMATSATATESFSFKAIDPLVIQICGHSLGGALAVIASLDIATNIQSIVRAAIIVNMPKDFGKTGKNFDKLIDLRAKKASVLPKVTVYTFGTPRIGNSVFSNLVEVTVGLDDYYRVEIDGNIIPLLHLHLHFYFHECPPFPPHKLCNM